MDEGRQRQELAAVLAPACLLSVPHSRQTVESSSSLFVSIHQLNNFDFRDCGARACDVTMMS